MLQFIPVLLLLFLYLLFFSFRFSIRFHHPLNIPRCIRIILQLFPSELRKMRHTDR
ncbi:hypothetical protein K457DRAFT_135166 [Linnemannia elongata AG-77]|uniref:Uncharacterized protein n=1 Tax=Linnemannia elongata AG-77 TaxID=1314771 RepID=A0A197K8B8_9FUNG|nr:hypothetical protein K457DRAFT_135166 [Linnemannia elongata AG-77]